MAKHWLVFCRQAAMSIVENLPTKLKTVNNQNPQKLGKLLPQPPSEQTNKTNRLKMQDKYF